MIRRIISLFGPKPTVLRDRFLQRFDGRMIVMHDGLSIGWVSELLKEAGGGGVFRFDLRPPLSGRPTPIEWVGHRWVASQGLPLPVLVRVRDGELQLRHLTRNGHPVHPSEINWMLPEMDAGRVHMVLRRSGEGFLPARGIPVSDNAVRFEIDGDSFEL